MKEYYVYIMTNRSGYLYIGVTNDIMRRVGEHKSRQIKGFASKYRIDRLVHVESADDVTAAIEREKQLKGWLRKRKLALIEEHNPTWRDLSESWFEGSALDEASDAKDQILHSVQDDNPLRARERSWQKP